MLAGLELGEFCPWVGDSTAALALSPSTLLPGRAKHQCPAQHFIPNSKLSQKEPGRFNSLILEWHLLHPIPNRTHVALREMHSQAELGPCSRNTQGC